MKTSQPNLTRSTGAFTLAEMLVAMAIFSLVVAAILSSQIFGLKMYRISDAKLSVTADTRAALNHLRGEVWTGKLLYVGSGNNTNFTLIAANQPHVGNALKICPTTDTNNYVLYFWDSTDSSLKRVANTNGPVQTVARNVIEPLVFRAEDFRGVTVSNYLNNRVIRLTLKIRQSENFGGRSEFYQLQTCVARRSID